MQAIDPAIGFANRMLEREDWARERLSAHAGRTWRVICGPVTTTLSIATSGLVSSADGAPDLILTISPLRVPTLAARPERWPELVAVEGDAALAATLSDLAQTLPWFVEQAFSRVLGPLIGTRVADAGRALLELPEHARRSFGASMRAYVRDEAGLGVGPAAFAAFSAEVAATAEGVDALGARLDRVMEARSAKAATGKKAR